MDWFQFIVSNIESAMLLIGVVVAIFSILSYRKTEKLKATFTILSEIQCSPITSSGVEILRMIDSKNNQETGEAIANTFLNPSKKLKQKEKDQIENARKIFSYLNLLEHLSLGISQKIYDEETCKKMIYSRVVNGWKLAESFIKKNRTSQRTLYQELELLVKRWEQSPLEKIR